MKSYTLPPCRVGRADEKATMKQLNKNKILLNFIFILISFIYVIKTENSGYSCLQSAFPPRDTQEEQTLDSDFPGVLQINLRVASLTQKPVYSLIGQEHRFLSGLRLIFPPTPIMHLSLNHPLLNSTTPVHHLITILKKSHICHHASEDGSFYEIC